MNVLLFHIIELRGRTLPMQLSGIQILIRVDDSSFTRLWRPRLALSMPAKPEPNQSDNHGDTRNTADDASCNGPGVITRRAGR